MTTMMMKASTASTLLLRLVITATTTPLVSSSSFLSPYHNQYQTSRRNPDVVTDILGARTATVAQHSDPHYHQQELQRPRLIGLSLLRPSRRHLITTSALQFSMRNAAILSLSDVNDDANALLHNDPANLPEGAHIAAIGSSWDDVQAKYSNWEELQSRINAIFVSHPNARQPLAEFIQQLPNLEWIHSRSAGIDFITSPTLSNFKGVVTNAKGQFSSTLAEYTMLACAYFAKDIVKLRHNHVHKIWDKYNVLELRHSTLGIIGYGDIGQAAAKLAHAYGMRIIAIRRQPSSQSSSSESESSDSLVSEMWYGSTTQNLNELFQQSDYVLVATPLTDETRGLIGKAQFDHAKSGLVLINVGRGPVIQENELIQALQDGRLRGAALDVLEQEPLPISSPLWDMYDQVLLSPHNMDKTATFMHESTEFYVKQQLPRFLLGEPLLNIVDPKAGY